MLLTDYFYPNPDPSWDLALAAGVRHGVIRLPDEGFDVTSYGEMRALYERFTSRGITPVVVEPMPNHLHDHIKLGDEKRDECIEKVIAMLAILDKLDIRTICFNWMAGIGWLRTTDAIPARGNTRVTGFHLADFHQDTMEITHEQLWENLAFFLRAVIPYAEKHNVRLALHPDDPPLPYLGKNGRILTSRAAFEKALRLCPSEHLGITFCQSNFVLMGEKLEEIIPAWRDKIFFVHFRNVTGTADNFHETFHDDGMIDMVKAVRLYVENGIDVPIRVDHVPTYPVGDAVPVAGYGAIGRQFAIGYLKGLLEAMK